MPHRRLADRLGFNTVRFDTVYVGRPIPASSLGRWTDDAIVSACASDLFRSGRCVILGVPGAFTPVCTQQHVPELVCNAPRLRQVGYDRLFCIAPNDPWTLARWADELDPRGQVHFLSDGNLDFARALDLTTQARDLFLGEVSKRYLMSTRAGVIERIKVEAEITDLSCTRTSELLI